MFTLKIDNHRGSVTELTHNRGRYAVVGIDGLTRPPTNINTAVAGGIDGSFFNSARVEQRNLVISIILRGDIEANRQALYSIFPLKSVCTIYFENKNRSVKIDGYTGAGVFRKDMGDGCWMEFNGGTLTIKANKIVLDAGTVEVTGDIEGSGQSVRASAILTNLTTGAYFTVNYAMQEGDTFTLSTVQGRLNVHLTRGDETIQLLNYIDEGSSWIKLVSGLNDMTYSTDIEDEFPVRISAVWLYGGV